jgi:hypothetical protein
MRFSNSLPPHPRERRVRFVSSDGNHYRDGQTSCTVVSLGGIRETGGDVTSFGFIGFSESAPSFPEGAP